MSKPFDKGQDKGSTADSMIDLAEAMEVGSLLHPHPSFRTFWATIILCNAGVVDLTTEIQERNLQWGFEPIFSAEARIRAGSEGIVANIIIATTQSKAQARCMEEWGLHAMQTAALSDLQLANVP